MDGWITIGTKIDTNKFDKQILELEKKITNAEQDKIDIDVELKQNEDELEGNLLVYKGLNEQAEEYDKKIQQIQNDLSKIPVDNMGLPTENVELWQELTKELSISAEEGTRLYSAMLEVDNNMMPILKKIETLKNEQEDVNSKIEEYKEKIDSIKLDRQVAEIGAMKEGFNGIGSYIQNLTGNIAKMALGVFGIRSAFLAVRQAMSMLSQYNQQLSNQIQAIKLALVSAIEPVINFVVNIIGKVVSLLGFILKKLFGIDIFARATALSFNNIKKSAQGTTKAVKELKKQLAGFDEINMLNKDGTTGLGNIAAGNVAGDVADLSQNLADLNAQGEEVFNNIKKWLLGSDKTTFAGIWEDNMKIISNFLGDVKEAFRPLANWINEKVWIPVRELFEQTWKNVEPYLQPIKNAFQKAINDIKPLWNDFMNNFLVPLWNGFNEKAIKPMVEMFKPIGIQIYNSLVPYINQIIDFLNSILGPFGITIQKMETKTITSINEIEKEAKKGIDEIGKKAENNGSKINKGLNNPLKNTLSNIKNVSKQTLKVKTVTSNLDTFKNKLKSIWDNIKKIMKEGLQLNIYASGGGGKGSSGYGGGGGFRAHGGIFYPSMLPKLASGGIINMPGKGSYYNGAIIGERGAEAVVPLTDTQQMELLGKTIGRYITVNANIVNSMNGRVISRELKTIQNEQNFAYNM